MIMDPRFFIWNQRCLKFAVADKDDPRNFVARVSSNAPKREQLPKHIMTSHKYICPKEVNTKFFKKLFKTFGIWQPCVNLPFAVHGEKMSRRLTGSDYNGAGSRLALIWERDFTSASFQRGLRRVTFVPTARKTFPVLPQLDRGELGMGEGLGMRNSMHTFKAEIVLWTNTRSDV